MAMHHLRPAWFEEPVPHTNTMAMVEVARRSPVPIATGESLSSKQQFADLLQHNAVSILQPEPLTWADYSPRARSPTWWTRITE